MGEIVKENALPEWEPCCNHEAITEQENVNLANLCKRLGVQFCQVTVMDEISAWYLSDTLQIIQFVCI